MTFAGRHNRSLCESLLAVDEQPVDRAEQRARTARDSVQPAELAVLIRRVRARAPDLVDYAARITVGFLFEVLLPEPKPRRANKGGVTDDDVHLRVVEERVLVQVRRADSEPRVVDDPDLCVHVHRRAVRLEERAREEPLLVASLARRAGEDAELTARVVAAVVRIGRQNDDDAKVVTRRLAKL